MVRLGAFVVLDRADQTLYDMARRYDLPPTIWAASNDVLAFFIQCMPAKDIKRSSELMFEALTARLVR